MMMLPVVANYYYDSTSTIRFVIRYEDICLFVVVVVVVVVFVFILFLFLFFCSKITSLSPPPLRHTQFPDPADNDFRDNDTRDASRFTPDPTVLTKLPDGRYAIHDDR